jgi:hypothetical protein
MAGSFQCDSTAVDSINNSTEQFIERLAKIFLPLILCGTLAGEDNRSMRSSCALQPTFDTGKLIVAEDVLYDIWLMNL